MHVESQLRGALAGLAATQHGIFTRGQALAEGYSDREVQRLLASGEWHGLRRGIYVEASVWSALTSAKQHGLMARALIRRLDEPAAISHWSAARLLVLPLYNAEKKLLHVTRTKLHRARVEAGVQHHVGKLPAGAVGNVDGIPVTAPARTVMDLACVGGFESGLIAADHAARVGLTTVTELKEEATRHLAWSASPVARQVALLVDPRAESPGETLTRIILARLGFPAPELQVKYFNQDGTLFARVDMGWPELGIILEFDGQIKYQRELIGDMDPGMVVFNEKKREDRLRDYYGLEVVRVTWADLQPSGQPELERRLLAAFERAARKRSAQA